MPVIVSDNAVGLLAQDSIYEDLVDKLAEVSSDWGVAMKYHGGHAKTKQTCSELYRQKRAAEKAEGSFKRRFLELEYRREYEQAWREGSAAIQF